VSSGAPAVELPAASFATRPLSDAPHLALRPPRKQRRSRRHFYSVQSTQDSIIVPPRERLGYLAESRLIHRAQAGDIDATKTVWARNARLAFTVINRHRGLPHQMADFFQEAQVGLGRAINRFEVDRLLAFSTYAYAAMRQHVTRQRAIAAFRASFPPALLASYLDFRARLAKAAARPDWFDLRAEYLAQDARRYRVLRRIHAIADAERLEPGAEPAAAQEPSYAPLLTAEALSGVRSAVGMLRGHERMVVERRYGLSGGGPETLEQIGERLGVTRERVRQLQMRAEARLREWIVTDERRDFLSLRLPGAVSSPDASTAGRHDH